MPVLLEPFAAMCKISLIDKVSQLECKTLRTTAQKVTGCELYATPPTSASLMTTSNITTDFNLNGCLKCKKTLGFMTYVTNVAAYSKSECVAKYIDNFKTGHELAAHKDAKDNCNQVVNYQLKTGSKTDGTENLNGCLRCTKGYFPTKLLKAANKPYYISSKCVIYTADNKKLNCEQFVADSLGNIKCYTCNANYVLNSSTLCVESKDNYAAHCRVQVSATLCKTCIDGYYFHGDVCKSAKLVGFALIALAALFFN